MINNDAYATGFTNTSVIENHVEILLNVVVFICVPYFFCSKTFSDSSLIFSIAQRITIGLKEFCLFVCF